MFLDLSRVPTLETSRKMTARRSNRRRWRRRRRKRKKRTRRTRRMMTTPSFYEGRLLQGLTFLMELSRKAFVRTEYRHHSGFWAAAPKWKISSSVPTHPPICLSIHPPRGWDGLKRPHRIFRSALKWNTLTDSICPFLHLSIPSPKHGEGLRGPRKGQGVTLENQRGAGCVSEPIAWRYVLTKTCF